MLSAESRDHIDEPHDQLPDFCQHGWTINNETKWFEMTFPYDFKDLLLVEYKALYEDDKESEVGNDSD